MHDFNIAEPLLRLRGVTHRFPGGAGVADIDLDLHRGETLGICGVSGCGKSTLLRLVAGLELPDSGEIHRPAGRLGMVFQDPCLLPWLSAQGNVELVLGHGHADRALAALREVGLEHAAERYPAQLSGGMRQRVGIARALAIEPEVLLMDEPFASLDYFNRLELLELVRERVSARKIAAVFISHDVPEIVRLCDTVLVLGGHPGRIVERVVDPLAPTARDARPGRRAALEERLLQAIRGGASSTAGHDSPLAPR